MSKVFDQYSKYYDLLYEDKDYKGEVEYINNLINQFAPNTYSILELGCGTGKHASLLTQKGFDIHGVDLSETMIEEALKTDVSCEVADVRTFRTDKVFDTVISLFHIINYQTTDKDLIDYLKTAYEHLPKGGIFIFDTWYGPAVLEQKPENRFKRMENNDLIVERTATSKHYINNNLVDVNYVIKITNKENNYQHQINETHKVRYLFKPEIELLLNQVGFELSNCEEWMSKNEPSESTWSVCFVGIKK